MDILLNLAAVILNSMNSTVDPCVDFYEYACGNWIKQHPIPDDAPSVSNFENLGQDLELALKGSFVLCVCICERLCVCIPCVCIHRIRYMCLGVCFHLI